jgi:CspA family cold shock protein
MPFGTDDFSPNLEQIGCADVRVLNEGQKIAFDVVADRKTGKSSADNLHAV